MDKILIVEDDTAILMGFRDDLEFEGFEVATAEDGKEGLKLALAGRFDLIILDILLPGINGFEVCKKLREAGLTTPVLMLTAARTAETDKDAAVEFDLATPYTGKYYAEVLGQVGSFYDGRGFSVEFIPVWSVSSDLKLSVDWQFNRYDFPKRNQELDSHVLRLRALATISIAFSAAAFIQYNSADHEVTANIRLRFNPREGNDLYVVFNEDLNTGRNRRVPVLPIYSGRALLVKYSYTFNF